MSREAKLLERMRRDPRGVRPEELFDVLRAEGVTVRRHGSHVGLQRGDVRMTLALPHGSGDRHLKTPYVVEALKRFGLAEAGDVEEAARRLHAGVDVRAEDGGYVAELGEMPGCMTHGETRAQAIANLEEAKACWLALGEE